MMKRAKGATFARDHESDWPAAAHSAGLRQHPRQQGRGNDIRPRTPRANGRIRSGNSSGNSSSKRPSAARLGRRTRFSGLLEDGEFESISGSQEILRNFERKSCNTVLLGSQHCIFGCIAWVPELYSETENRPAVRHAVFTASILPRWFLNQWLTDSLVAHANFYFL
jgi:hypothetical protein